MLHEKQLASAVAALAVGSAAGPAQRPTRLCRLVRRNSDGFVAADNSGGRPKPLRSPTPYAFMGELEAAEPERFKANPHHQMSGLNTY